MKNINKGFFLLCLLAFFYHLNAQEDFYKTERSLWLQKAEENMPELIVTKKQPKSIIEIVSDESAFQGWKVVQSEKSINSFYENVLNKTEPSIIDFGEHLTGYFTFTINPANVTPDAPLRLKFTFGEVPSEIMVPFDPYKGSLSRAWMQDETVTVMTLPATITIPRRLSFRYVKIEVTASPSYDFYLSDIILEAGTSAANFPTELNPSADELIRKIDYTGLQTLKECMQTVYEDGPKRDQRLWIGDLYLQSMSNDFSFRQNDLTRRCLYLLAGLSHKNGLLHPCIYETPEPHEDSRLFLFEYSLLFNATLKDYLKATGDKQTALDLWVVAKKQLEIVQKYLKDDGLIDFERANREWWVFIDWREGLHKEVPLQGVCIFALEETYELAKMLGKEEEVNYIPSTLKKMRSAAHKAFYNKKTGFFTGTLNDQISFASQIWMTLSKTASQKEAAKALSGLDNTPEVCYPGTPYLYHYYIQALIDCGLENTAKNKLTEYWGGMIKKGADTFWEAFDPANDFLSPYNFYPLNSYCHAWSCTPVYFIRKYPEIFQR